MKVNVNTDEKVTVSLKNGDILNISTNADKNNYVIKCKNNNLYFDNISCKKIKNLKSEEHAIKVMKNFLKNDKKQ